MQNDQTGKGNNMEQKRAKWLLIIIITIVMMMIMMMIMMSELWKILSLHVRVEVVVCVVAKKDNIWPNVLYIFTICRKVFMRLGRQGEWWEIHIALSTLSQIRPRTGLWPATSVGKWKRTFARTHMTRQWAMSFTPTNNLKLINKILPTNCKGKYSLIEFKWKN